MMRLRLLILLFLSTASAIAADAQKSTPDDSLVMKKLAENNITVDAEYVRKHKKSTINNYCTIGVQYGVDLMDVSWDPVRKSSMVFTPVNAGIVFTNYNKLFGYMPYFGVELGAFYSRSGYKFTKSSSGYADNILGATEAIIQNIEIPALAIFHVDFWKMRLLLGVGIYGGYRFSIERSGYPGGTVPSQYAQYEHCFHPNERQFDYGLKFRGGFGFIFDPIELHFTVGYKYSWSMLYKPNVNQRTLEEDSYSKYYYKWAYPTNLIVAVGVHYQLTRRTGATKKQLKMEAQQEAMSIYEKAQEELKARELEEAATNTEKE